MIRPARYFWIIGVIACLPFQSKALCFCLKSKGSPSFVLKLTLTDEEWKAGTVQYRGSGEAIPIVFAGSKELERHDGRPSYIRYTWEERDKGHATGTYILCIQGANVYESRYIRRRDGRKFELERVLTEDDCGECFRSE